ncbi:MAG: hypothetical protein KGO05_13300 [Chloroflexota bacterium]|nr:hypothetical protein [Chloroflexota bacterium]
MPLIKRYSAMLALLLALAFALTGCMRIDRSVAINGDGSGSYTLTIGFVKSVATAQGGQVAASMDAFGAQIVNAGGSTRRYGQGDFTYWAYTSHFTSVADLNRQAQRMPGVFQRVSSTSGSLLPADQNNNFAFSESSNGVIATFRVGGHMSLVYPPSVTSALGPDATAQLKSMRESISVSMPGWYIRHNGGSVSGNTITYSVGYGQRTTIYASATILTLPAIIGLGILLLILIIAALLWLRPSRSAAPHRPAPAFVPATPDAPTIPDIPTAETPPSPPRDASGPTPLG